MPPEVGKTFQNCDWIILIAKVAYIYTLYLHYVTEFPLSLHDMIELMKKDIEFHLLMINNKKQTSHKFKYK